MTRAKSAILTDEELLYFYKAVIQYVYDGDTVTADIDLGCGIWMRDEKLRLCGIDAPELRGASRERGLASRDYLRQLVDGNDVIIKTHKDKKGKYGRYLATLFFARGKKWVNVNEEMVKAGHADWYV